MPHPAPLADVTYDLLELSDRSGVTPRTVRYYIQQGLLPSPGQMGPGTKYTAAHLNRLRLIRQLQRAHLPLAEIRHRLQPLDDAAVAASLEEGAATVNATSSAVDYVRSVLGTAGAPAGEVASVIAHGTPARRQGQERSQWERITLGDDVELQVRRPLSREQNRRVERLLEAARRIFEDES